MVIELKVKVCTCARLYFIATMCNYIHVRVHVHDRKHSLTHSHMFTLCVQITSGKAIILVIRKGYSVAASLQTKPCTSEKGIPASWKWQQHNNNTLLHVVWDERTAAVVWRVTVVMHVWGFIYSPPLKMEALGLHPMHS